MNKVNEIQDISKKHNKLKDKASKIKNHKIICLLKFTGVFHQLIIIKMNQTIIIKSLSLTCFLTRTINRARQIWWTALHSTFNKIQIRLSFIKDKVMSASSFNNRLINKKFQFKFWILKENPKSRQTLKTVQALLKFNLTFPETLLIFKQWRTFQQKLAV